MYNNQIVFYWICVLFQNVNECVCVWVCVWMSEFVCLCMCLKLMNDRNQIFGRYQISAISVSAETLLIPIPIPKPIPKDEVFCFFKFLIYLKYIPPNNSFKVDCTASKVLKTFRAKCYALWLNNSKCVFS